MAYDLNFVIIIKYEDVLVNLIMKHLLQIYQSIYYSVCF